MSSLLRGLVVAVGLLAAACSPPAQPAQDPAGDAAPPAADASAAQPFLDLLTPIVAAEIGKPVRLEATTANITNDWAYIAARTLNADGSAIDWTTTNLAGRFEHGAMDESGGVYALLRNQNGAWVIVEQVLAPTDVAWVDWAARHNVPPGVIDVPAAP